jgi:hypothetical protein
VTLLHVQGTIEDRLAVIAAWRSDRHRNTNAITVLREPEIDFLLGHTTLQVLAELYTPGR